MTVPLWLLVAMIVSDVLSVVLLALFVVGIATL